MTRVRFKGDAKALLAHGISQEHHAAILGKVGTRTSATLLLAGEEAVRVVFDGVEHAFHFLLSSLEPVKENN